MERTMHFMASGIRSFLCGWFVIVALAVCVCSVAEAAVLVLEWDANREPDLAGYRIHWGAISRGTNTHSAQFMYGNTKEILPTVTRTAIRDVPVNRTSYITVTAFNTQGAESSFGYEIAYAARDADGDGIEDSWEVRSGLTGVAGNAFLDDDGDRMSNYEEYVAGTNPKDNKSRFVCAARKTFAGIEISWQGVAGRIYTLERSMDLKAQRPFRPIALKTAEQTGCLAYTDRAGLVSLSHMYRVRVQ